VARVELPGSLEEWTVTAGLAGLAITLAIGSLTRRADEPDWLRPHLIAMALGPPLIVFALSRIRTIYQPRYLLAIIPALVLLCVRARPLALLWAALAIPITVGLWVEPRYHPWLEKPDYRGAAQRIAARCSPEDVIQGAAIHRRPMLFYLQRTGGTCLTYLMVNSSNAPRESTDPAGVSRPGRGSSRPRNFVLDTIPLGAAEARSVDRGGADVRRSLIFIDRRATILRVWLDEP